MHGEDLGQCTELDSDVVDSQQLEVGGSGNGDKKLMYYIFFSKKIPHIIFSSQKYM